MRDGMVDDLSTTAGVGLHGMLYTAVFCTAQLVALRVYTLT